MSEIQYNILNIYSSLGSSMEKRLSISTKIYKNTGYAGL